MEEKTCQSVGLTPLSSHFMKFELEPDNRGQPDEVLLADLRRIATALKKDFVTKDEYDKDGRFCSATFQKRFGSWSTAHERAGLRKIRNYGATAEDCIKDLKRVAEILGKSTISQSEYIQYGKFSPTLFVRRLGSWRKVLQLANLQPSTRYFERVPDEELFENLEHMWETLGRQPKRKDFSNSLSRFSYTLYKRRFGSFRKALENFVASFENQAPKITNEIPRSEPGSDVIEPFHKTPRNVSWRLRFLVMRRDNFKCCACGTSPALKPGVVLVIDHIIPWTKGGETVIGNLQTLCEPCNGGKSNLSINQ